jgi:hypothetical protein
MGRAAVAEAKSQGGVHGANRPTRVHDVDMERHLPHPDATMSMLEAVADGSIEGLATYHLLKMQLLGIRDLPERSDADRNARPD